MLLIECTRFTFASFDYSQIEMRILAHMSRYLSASVAIVDGHRDKYLLEFFSAGKDIHKLIASRWLNKDPDQVSDRERENAKSIISIEL